MAGRAWCCLTSAGRAGRLVSCLAFLCPECRNGRSGQLEEDTEDRLARETAGTSVCAPVWLVFHSGSFQHPDNKSSTTPRLTHFPLHSASNLLCNDFSFLCEFSSVGQICCCACLAEGQLQSGFLVIILTGLFFLLLAVI